MRSTDVYSPTGWDYHQENSKLETELVALILKIRGDISVKVERFQATWLNPTLHVPQDVPTLDEAVWRCVFNTFGNDISWKLFPPKNMFQLHRKLKKSSGGVLIDLVIRENFEVEPYHDFFSTRIGGITVTKGDVVGPYTAFYHLKLAFLRFIKRTGFPYPPGALGEELKYMHGDGWMWL